jgi:hypothetical protein
MYLLRVLHREDALLANCCLASDAPTSSREGNTRAIQQVANAVYDR